MKVAIVHDYIKEYGGAERVLEALCEIYPEAPIYTAFYKKDSPAFEKFKNKKVISSWVQNIPFFVDKLHSPLRFLTPMIWNSFDFSAYDVVIGSASWYVTKGFKKPFGKLRAGGTFVEICYCHTPPRWLYGYKTSIEWQRFWPVKIYGSVVGHFMRIYDYNQAQRVDYFIANSEEVKARIQKFYRRSAAVIYPPVSLATSKQQAASSNKKDYYLIVARMVGGKGLDLAVDAAENAGFNLKIAGVSSGYYTEHKKLKDRVLKNIDFLGAVTDEELIELYGRAKAFLALATDEDFGITPVEAMLCGTPVIAFYGGGYKETVLDGKTGVFFKESNVESLTEAIKKLDKMKIDPKDCIKQAEKFSKEKFKKEISEFVNAKIKK